VEETIHAPAVVLDRAQKEAEKTSPQIVAKQDGSRGVESAIIRAPEKGVLLTTPLTVSGSAPQSWFVKDFLEIRLMNTSGEVVAEQDALLPRTLLPVAPGELLPFDVTLTFDNAQYSGQRLLLLVKKPGTSALNEQIAQTVEVMPFALEQTIRVQEPIPGAEVIGDTVLRGEAAGWYFEGDFPVEVIGSNGEILATGFVSATEDWMQVGFVPFIGSISITPPAGMTTGTLRFRKDNPSGIEKFDASFDVPVRFATAQ